MQKSATAAIYKDYVQPKTQLFSLKTPYMEQGRVTQLVAETPNLWIHTKVNAEGGENEIHKHITEDHAFIVLEGQMSVFDEKGGEIEVKQYQGVMIPKGAYYRYHNTGEGNLVVIRVGAGQRGQEQQAGQETRLGADGKPLTSGTPENRNKPPIEKIGSFFAEAAG
jgi:mannose-6-phosphate isomerase-like protein (cupin superfamily)